MNVDSQTKRTDLLDSKRRYMKRIPRIGEKINNNRSVTCTFRKLKNVQLNALVAQPHGW